MAPEDESPDQGRNLTNTIPPMLTLCQLGLALVPLLVSRANTGEQCTLVAGVALGVFLLAKHRIII